MSTTVGYPSIWIDGEERPAALTLWLDGEEVALDGIEVTQPFSSDVPYSVADMLADNPFYVAHRCSGGNWPEWSRPGVLGSMQAGYKALEVSVWRCASGEFVCSHDENTIRMTGENFSIPNTSWSLLSQLTSKAPTGSPVGRQPLMLLDELMDLARSRVVWVDHKATSNNLNPTQAELDSRTALLDYLDTFTDGTDRFVWKGFVYGFDSAAEAQGRGYTTNAMMYPNEHTFPVWDEVLATTDIFGLSYSAPISDWNALLATGKRVLGHVIANTTDRDLALSKGATGIISSRVEVLQSPPPEPEPALLPFILPHRLRS